MQESGLKGFMGLEVNPEKDYGDLAFQPIQVFPEAAVAGVFHPYFLHSIVAGKNFLFFYQQLR